ncbi:MAG: hypothetical protein V4735_04590 [Pseudomonadota bacterium]
MAALKKSLLKRAKKSEGITAKELEALTDIADDVIESDFVPYACLFDKDSIATKDGELMQTIKITGLGFDAQSEGDLRASIRTAIREAIPDASYAIWLHTLRRKQAAAARTHFPDQFSGKIDEAWRTMQPASTMYVNELYVTIVRASGSLALANGKLLAKGLLPKRTSIERTAAMQEQLRALSTVVNAMVTMLRPFGARLLTVVERKGIFYSEQLEFLEKLINLEERPMPLPMRDLSHVLTSGDITFGYNAMEVRTAEGHRRFAAILTLKEYKESTLAGIDKFLEIPCEVIISQCFDFTGADIAREAYEKQARYLTYSGDTQLAEWMEIDRLSDITRDGAQAFGEQQTSIFLIAPGVNQLESNLRMVQRALNRLGMVVIREDLRFEECYWAQLPANFTFISRKNAVDTDHLAGFVNLQAAPMGNAAGSPWGPPLSVFTTVQDAPYFFNFQRDGSGHTIILGNPGSGRTTFTHFLLAQARKMSASIWYLDAHGRAGPFMQAMGGSVVTPGTASCMLNPFHLAETPANREFLALWLSTLIDPTGAQLNRSSLSYFQSVIDRMLQMPREQRRISAMIPIIREADGLLAATVARYASGGIYGDLFDMPQDTFAPGKLTAWDISRWMADPAARVPLAGYLLHRLTGALNQSPTLMVLDEAFAILDTPLFGPRAGGWCDYLAQNNAAAILTTDAIEASAASPFTATIAAKAATIFAMPDRSPDSGYSMGFGLSAQEVATLGYIDKKAHHILQKRGNEAVVIKMRLALPPQTMLTLAGASNPAVSPADTLANLMGYTKHAV